MRVLNEANKYVYTIVPDDLDCQSSEATIYIGILYTGGYVYLESQNKFVQPVNS